jgi:serine/threonine-protein kinase RsbW
MSDEKAKIKTGNDTLEKQFELTVESKLENLAKIRLFIDKTMRHFCIDSLKTIYAVQLSVDEACTNIIEHGYFNKTWGKIVIRCILLDEKFIVNIMDWGESFDPTTIPKPDTKSGLNERKAGGLGIYFMREYMDEVSYVRLDGMNLLAIAKYIKLKN